MEFKEEAMKRVERGYAQQAAAERLGIDARRLSDGLQRKREKPVGVVASKDETTTTELIRLRRELKQLKQEREILTKATVFFVNESK